MNRDELLKLLGAHLKDRYIPFSGTGLGRYHMLEGALMGYGDLVDLPEHFDGSPPTLKIKPTVTVEQMRRVCTALEECTRIINSDEYLT